MTYLMIYLNFNEAPFIDFIDSIFMKAVVLMLGGIVRNGL